MIQCRPSVEASSTFNRKYLAGRFKPAVVVALRAVDPMMVTVLLAREAMAPKSPKIPAA
jgi:hypothetical protein